MGLFSNLFGFKKCKFKGCMNAASKGGKYCIEHHSKSDRAELKKHTQTIDVKNGNEALLKAIQDGNISVAREMLEEGADVNAKDENGVTALMATSFKGYSRIAKALLAKGADVNAKDANGITALLTAAGLGHNDCVNELLDKGAGVNVKGYNGVTALMSASFNGHSRIAKALLVKAADVNTKDSDGVTALIMASEKGHSNIVKALLAKGADVNAENNNGNTALDAAEYGDHDEVIQILIGHRADKTGNTGFTENCPSLRGGSPKEIIEYWEQLSTSQKACGNCRHLSYGVGALDPLCYMEQTIAIINKLDPSNIKPKEVKPTDYCLSWLERG